MLVHLAKKVKVDLIILLSDNGYPPVNRAEVYKGIFEQAENFLWRNI
jgi:type I restriction enzyme R subunit